MTNENEAESKRFSARSLSERYDFLQNELRTIAEVKIQGLSDDNLHPATMALEALIRFLRGDPQCAALLSTELLGTLHAALHDALQGAKPPLLYKKRANGAPTHLSEAALRAQIVFSMSLLLNAGFKREEAAKNIAADLARGGVRTNGALEITSSQVSRWHYERDGKSLSGSDEVYKALEDRYPPQGWPTDRDAALRIVRGRVAALKMAGF